MWLHRNKIGEQGATAIAEGLKFNGALNKLGLSSNKIGPSGATAIADALKVNGAADQSKKGNSKHDSFTDHASSNALHTSPSSRHVKCSDFTSVFTRAEHP